jgi:hypothetical protein
MYCPETSRISQTQDVMWLGRMLHTKRDAALMQQLPIVTVPISIYDASEDTEIQRLEVVTFPLSEEKGVESKSPSEKTDEWIQAKTRYGRAVGRKDCAYNPNSGTTIKWSDVVAEEVNDVMTPSANYYEVFGIDEDKVKVLQIHNDSVSEYINIGAGMGGGFTNTNELCVMNYHEPINGPDGKKWKAKVKTEHGRMVKSDIFEKVKLSKLPSDVKVIDTTWAMKKKSNKTLCERNDICGFKQVKGQHYNASSISVPVTNGVTIKLVLMLMIASGCIAHVICFKSLRCMDLQ